MLRERERAERETEREVWGFCSYLEYVAFGWGARGERRDEVTALLRAVVHVFDRSEARDGATSLG